jgi:hypothetical protein
MGLLEGDQLAPEAIVLGVGDLGPALDVVQLVVPPDLLAELLEPRRDVGRLMTQRVIRITPRGRLDAG